MNRCFDFWIKVTLCLIIISFFSCLEAKVEVLDFSINPKEVFNGEVVKFSYILKIKERIDKECALFLHLEDLTGRRFLAISFALSRPLTKFNPGEILKLGPFSLFIPLDLSKGEYKIKTGLFYTETTPLGAKYIKIPYINPGIKDWLVGKIKVKGLRDKKYDKESYIVTVVDSLTKIFPEKKYFREEIKDYISLYSAKNEYESFQIVIMANEELRDLKIEVTDLLSKGNDCIKKENITLYKVGFVNTKRPYYNTLKIGLWPDPLIPLKGTINIKKDTVQPIWVSIYVPEGTSKGNYEGKIRIKINNKEFKEIKINLKVWDFILPKYSNLKTAFDFYEYLVDWRTPKKEKESEEDYKKRKEELKKNYYLDMLKHRINPIHNVGNPKFLGKKDNRYILDFKEFDEKVEFYQKYGQSCFGIAQEWPYGYKGDWTDKWYGFKDKEAVEGVFREYGRHLEEKSWLDNSYAYIFDETFHRVREITSLIHKGHPRIKNLLTMTPEEGYPDVDIWCVRINNIEKEVVEEFKNQGKEIWMYVAGKTSPYPTLNLDLPSIEYRIIPWICWKYDLKGLLYWCVNWWHNVDPWQDAMSYPQQNGNGFLYYPSLDGETPVGSIRLEVLRDGLEDYEYFYILKEKSKNLKEEDYILIQKINGILEKIIESPAYFSDKSNDLLFLRKKVAEVIEKLF